jgi:hypothetical protein
MMSPGPRVAFAGGLAALALWVAAPGSEARTPVDPGAQRAVHSALEIGLDSVDAHRRAEEALSAYHRAPNDFLRREASFTIPRQESAVQRFERLLDAIDESRRETIGILDGLAEVSPGSDFVLGFRVGLRIELGLVAEVRGIVSSCEGSAWWCAALDGLARHLEGDVEGADAAFSQAVAVMPAADRCDLFRDAHHLVQRGVRRDWDTADCDELEQLWTRTWWLADPLHAFEGNDRRNEHMSRVVLMILHHELLALNGGSCSSEHHGRTLEAGWPPWGIVSIHPSRVAVPWDGRGIRTVPTGRAFVDPLASDASDWLPEATRQGERYRPTFGDLAPLSQQTGFFERGDSLLVVSSIEPPRGVVALGLARSRNEHETPRIERARVAASGAARTVQLETRVERARWLVSVEGLGAGAGGYRARFGHALPEPGESGLAVSDVVLFAWEDDLEPVLDSIRTRIRGSDVLDRSEPTGIFWEVYGGSAGDPLEISVTVQRDDRSFFRRAGEALRVLSPHQPIPVRWEGIRTGDEIQGIHLAVDLGNVAPGSYTLEVGTGQGEGRPAVARRGIEVR